jgi:hypothetical protein
MIAQQTITNILDDNATHYASNVTALGLVTLSATGPADELGHFVTTTNDAAANLGTTTLAIVGLGPNGEALSETITLGTDGTVVVGTKYFKTITTMTVGGVDPGAATFDIGISDDAVSAIIPLDWRSGRAALVQVDTNATVADWTIQECYQSVLKPADTPVTNIWVAITALSAKTADTTGAATVGATAVRLLLNSASASTCDVTWYVRQPLGGCN